MCEEFADVGFVHLIRVTLIVEKYEPFDPVHIGLFCPVTEVPDPNCPTYLIQQFWLDHHLLLPV